MSAGLDSPPSATSVAAAMAVLWVSCALLAAGLAGAVAAACWRAARKDKITITDVDRNSNDFDDVI